MRSPGPGRWGLVLDGSQGFPSVRTQVEITPGTSRLEITLPAPGATKLWGRVADPAGQSVVGARLIVGRAEAFTDAQGNYEIPDAAPGSAVPVCLQYGEGNDRRVYPLPPVKITHELRQRIDFTTPGTHALEVELTGMTADTVAEIGTVTLAHVDSNLGVNGYFTVGETCHFEHLPSGRYRLEAEIGQRPFEPTFVEIAGRDHRVQVTYVEPATLTVIVEMVDGGPPPSGVMIATRDPVHGPRPSNLDRNGVLAQPEYHAFVLVRNLSGTTLVPPGERDVRVHAPGFESSTFRVHLDPGEQSEIRVPLTRTARRERAPQESGVPRESN